MATPPPSSLPAPRSQDLIWQAPLVPVALAFTSGIVADRYFSIPMPISLAWTCGLLVASALFMRKALNFGAVAALALAIAALGAGYHQWYRETVAADDIRLFATSEGRPVRLRGVIDSEPIQVRGVADDPLRTFPTKATTRMAVAVRQIQQPNDWLNVSGVVHAMMAGKREDLHVGDEVELVGKLVQPPPAANPGGFDYADFLRDRGIGAILSVPDATDAVDLRREGWPRSVVGLLGFVRARATKLIEKGLNDKTQQHVAAALLLGDSSGMTSDNWEVYLRTGVIHVLAISGQHLIVLSHFLWLLFRGLRIGRRKSAMAICLLLLAYALMTGARPPIMRAAWMSITFTAAIFLRRFVMPANSFALSWIGVAIVNPASVFDTGCQLSFLAVAMILWGTFQLAFLTQNITPWTSNRAQEGQAMRLLTKKRQDEQAMKDLIDESRSWIELAIRHRLGWLFTIYLENMAIWLVVTPLVATRFHMVSPVAVLIGPLVVILSSYALLFGLGLLVFGFLGGPVLALFAWPTQACLTGCDFLVNLGTAVPGGYFYVADVPAWWIGSFYTLLLLFLFFDRFPSWKPWMLAAVIACFAFGVVQVFRSPHLNEFRCTFLSVGHGGCTVIETPSGRVIVYDAGAIGGPDVTRKHIAPFLWSRGYRRIDEIIISHGDLDHFNGMPALLDRFAVGQVTLTPTFADRTKPGIAYTLRALERRGLATRVVYAPMRWETDNIDFEVLHPPAKGPQGIENERSLVLAIRHQGLDLLLTGDLEKAGLERVLSLPPRPVDVLMAPHHGSSTANTKELATWARPKLVVSCQGPPKSVPKEPNPYEALGARWASTWSQGAVTIRREQDTWFAETYLTKNRWPLRDGR